MERYHSESWSAYKHIEEGTYGPFCTKTELLGPSILYLCFEGVLSPKSYMDAGLVDLNH